jgi:hypothetical protein
MRRVKWRWLLPLGHTVIDCALVFALIMYAHRLFQPKKSEVHPPTRFHAALFLQEGDSVEWDPRTLPPPGPFSLIMTGNLPAGLASSVLRPEAGMVTRKKHWDPVWFALQEAVSFMFWYLIGAWVDAGHPKLGKVMLAFVVGRFVLAVVGVYEIGWRIQVLFWLGFCLWLACAGLSLVFRVVSSAATRARS